MFDAIRNWFEVRAALKDERRLRTGQAELNTLVVQDKLKHVDEMLRTGQRVYAAATMDEVLARFPDEAAELSLTPSMLINLGRLDDAERLTLRGIQRNPDSRDFARLYCEIADHRGDIPERLRRWGAFRRRYPAYGLGFLMEAAALLAAGQPDAAEALLAEGLSVVKDDLGLATDYARRAEARCDWPEARRRWTVVLDRFDAPIGASRAAAALIEQGLYDQAEAELTAARKRFPLEAQMVDDLAMLAERRGDVDRALLIWSELRRDLPHIGRGYTEPARLLRDRDDPQAADALIIEGAGRAPSDWALQFAFAEVAERQGDWEAAAQRWNAGRTRFPLDLAPARGEPVALRRLGRLDAAEQVLRAAIDQFPDEPGFLRQLAEVAEERGDLPLAVERWRTAVAADPGTPATHLALARALAAAGDRAAADAALKAAIARLPDAPELEVAYATLAAEDGRAEVAARRWAAARARLGPAPNLVRAEAAQLRDAGRLDAARALLTEALDASPDHLDLLHDLGKLAGQEGDWGAAETCWRTIMNRHPQIGWGWTELAHALAVQGRAAEADAVLAAGCEAHPKHFEIAAAWARLPSTARDWPEAQRRWTLLRDRFPREGHPLWQLGIALRESGQADAARDLFLLGAKRYPADASFPHDLARLAETRGDHAEAEIFWRRYVELEPHAWWGWLGLAAAVRAQGRIEAAEAVLHQGSEACPNHPACLEALADWARQRQDWPEAARRAGQLTERFPSAWQGIWGQAVALRDQGRLHDAHELLVQGAERHPDIPTFAHDLARLAEARANWPEAAHWWRRFLAFDDTQPWANGALVHALFMQNDAEAGDAHLCAALARHPHTLGFHQEYALAAIRRGDLAAGLERWAAVVARFPDDARSLAHLADAHAAAGQPDRAAELLQAGLERFPQQRDFAHVLLRIARDRRDPIGMAHWRARLVGMLRAALDRQPGALDVLIEFVNLMAEVPQTDWPISAPEIERPLQAAAEQGSNDVFLHLAYAAVAGGRRDWAEQHRRLAAAAQRFPNDPLLRTRLAAAHEIMLAETGTPSPDRPSAAASGIHPDLPPGELVLHFESLGGGGAREEGWGFGCEFGYFQREYGQEPLSLLRWASIGPKNLIRALDEDLSGFGDAAALHLDDARSEDWSADETVYHSRFDHTHLSCATVPRAEAQRLVAMRMRFLARKLLGDLQAGEKLFVYRVIDRTLGDAAILRLAQAVNRHGNNVLLFVTLADADHPAFSVRHVHPGLMVGYLDFFRARDGAFREWNHAGWLRLCREAVRVLLLDAPEIDGFPPVPADWEAAARTLAAQREADCEAIRAAAQQAIEAGDPAEAELRLRNGAETYPEIDGFAHDLARLCERRADWAEAERWWRQFISLKPKFWWAHTALAEALHRQGRRDAAEAVLLAGHDALPDEPAILLHHARLAEQAAEWAEAEHRFARLFAVFPEVADGLIGQATAARAQGRHDDAERLVRLGAERHPQVAGFQHDLARLAEQRQDFGAAEAAWRRFIAIDPGPWWAHNALARACLAQGAWPDAVAILRAHYSDDAAGDPNGIAEAIDLLGARLDTALLPLIEELDRKLAPHVATASAEVGLAHARAARFLGQFDAYRARAEALADRFPQDALVRETLRSARELAPVE